MPSINRAAIRRARTADRLARWVVTLGGAVVIVSVLGILVLIVATALPLFYSAAAKPLAETGLPPSLKAEEVRALALDSGANASWLVAQLVDAAGKFHFIDLRGQAEVGQEDAAATLFPRPASERLGENSSNRPPPGRQAISLAGACPCGPSDFTLRWSNGAISLVHVAAAPDAAGGSPKYTLEPLATVAADALGVPEQAVLYRTGEETACCAALYAGRKIAVTCQAADASRGKPETKLVLEPAMQGTITVIAMSRDGHWLYAGTSVGSLLWWELSDGHVADHDSVPPPREQSPITSLRLLLGDITLVAGDAAGNVTNWFFVRPEAEPGAAASRGMVKEPRKLTYIRSLTAHASGIRQIVPSPRNRAVLVADEGGATSLDYTTSERRLLNFNDVSFPAFARQGDVVAGLSGDRIKAWRVEGRLWGIFSDRLYPEVSWTSLCGRVWYEGHDAADFTWQPQGNADTEPKLSLVPLVFGTLKGTFYAMLLGGPLALGAAAYVSQFVSPQTRAWMKPGIEMMAAVPSVVLGFLVGLWFAPLLSDWLLAFFLSIVAIPLCFAIFLALWRIAGRSPAAAKWVRGREFLIGGLLVAVGVATAAGLSSPAAHLLGWIDPQFHNGDVIRWLHTRLGLVYVQGNSLLIAFGVGFMVIPLIFTLSEDALSSVPHNMTAASMALGASRWQTLRRVVLPSASPGIFAAVMIGFGRAVGETMVFLMATGNTPIIDLSPFNGMRTLAANIAEEKPGAPEGFTLYRTLFLCAVILFVMTFFLNTLAEFVRQRLRKRYGQF